MQVREQQRLAQEIPVPADRAPVSFADVAAKLVDLRGVAKPPVFSGKESDWADFRFRLESIAALLGCDKAMEMAAEMKEEPSHIMMLPKGRGGHFAPPLQRARPDLWWTQPGDCSAAPGQQRPAGVAAADARVRAGHGKPVLRDAFVAAYA